MDQEEQWRGVAAEWTWRDDTTYLNHGSFGLAPRAVLELQQDWQRRMQQQPMDFYTRQLRPAWEAARAEVARFVHADAQDLIFVENATVGMNIVAYSFPLAPGDEVVLNDHEYGAVQRIWERRCGESGASVRQARLPARCEDRQQIVDAILAAATDRTRLIVVSHITSPTAITLPVTEICHAARARGIAVCVDGPHAVAQLPLDLRALGADFYTASCHKWLSAPLGSGFLYVARPWQDQVRPPQLSWGLLLPDRPQQWWEEFVWTGTRDPSAYLCVPAAIRFLERVGLEAFRARTHALAQYARQQLVDLFGTQPLVPDSPDWYTAMAHVPLPPGPGRPLQNRLWEQYGIEVPIVEFQGNRYVRVSCHLYNTPAHVDRLTMALKSEA